eukprot:6668552-Pyramimonas_sp.AAC.1
MAVAGMKELGAAEIASAAIPPDADLSGCPEWAFAQGDADLTLHARDIGSAKRFLNAKSILVETCTEHGASEA